MVQNDGVGPDVLEQQRLDEVHAKSIFARQAMRCDILRDVRVLAEVVRELRRPRGGINVCYKRKPFSSRRGILRPRMESLDTLKRP